ncbi:MAG TPA: 50S ribosomal protein L24 [archaeon]|nr:50S ribosomal protein L24 [archaeon]
MKEFSSAWKTSTQPRKQRKYRYNASGHLRQNMLSAHLDKVLRKETGRRSMKIRKGDEVVVTRGEFRKTRGAVTAVDMKALKIYVEGVKRKKGSGKEANVPVDPSNVSIVKIYRDDKKRRINK